MQGGTSGTGGGSLGILTIGTLFTSSIVNDDRSIASGAGRGITGEAVGAVKLGAFNTGSVVDSSLAHFAI